MLNSAGVWMFWRGCLCTIGRDHQLAWAAFSGTFMLQGTALVGILLGGYASDRVGQKNVRRRPLIMAICYFCAAPILLVFLAQPGYALLSASVALFSLVRAFGQANENLIMCDLLPPRARSTALGIFLMANVGAGSITILLAAWLRGLHGLGFAFACISGITAGCIFGLAAIICTRDLARSQRPSAAITRGGCVTLGSTPSRRRQGVRPAYPSGSFRMASGRDPAGRKVDLAGPGERLSQPGGIRRVIGQSDAFVHQLRQAADRRNDHRAPQRKCGDGRAGREDVGEGKDGDVGRVVKQLELVVLVESGAENRDPQIRVPGPVHDRVSVVIVHAGRQQEHGIRVRQPAERLDQVLDSLVGPDRAEEEIDELVLLDTEPGAGLPAREGVRIRLDEVAVRNRKDCVLAKKVAPELVPAVFTVDDDGIRAGVSASRTSRSSSRGSCRGGRGCALSTTLIPSDPA